ncbi:CMRF35-like molecule 1 isoform X2 [Siniperca chuatsi]|nr:CMRF35-like molecule 1 isoform X2 [Siniperca chuatsi]
MKILHVVLFCCFSVVCVEASAVLEVSGHVGGEVSIYCSGSWTNSSENYNMYFCKEVCSRENILIQTERRRLEVTRRGRYSVTVNRGAFNVTIKRLKRADAGRYHCGVGKTLNVLYPEVNLIVLDASTVPSGSPPSTTTLQTEAQTQPRGSFPSSTEPPRAALTLPATEKKKNQQAATKLSDTTVVIIVSVSLALLVCAIIPLIFYRHCRSTVEGQNGPEGNKADYYEESADVASTQAAVKLQSLEPDAGPESSAQDASQCAAIYQALDPKSLD